MSSTLLRRIAYRLSVSGRHYSTGKTTPQPTKSQTPGESKIYQKLQSKFVPSHLQVQDVSGGCGDFYAITITSDSFKGLSTLKQHRMVQEELKDEIASIHGLQLKTSTG